ncbi:MAG TPA: glutamine synthetase, partial [Dongiaceae bacterium]|nr:glutamine synthetase [Dongiaceae bacterium]
MATEELVFFATNDLSGVTRGKSFPCRDLEERMVKGVGWVPANQALTPFNIIADPNPFGPIGDLRLLPDPATQVRVDGFATASPLHLFLCDIVETDGAPWRCCARLFLKQALADLEAEAGLRLLAAFEQEFMLKGLDGPVAPVFSVASLRAADRFAIRTLEALRAAAIDTEMLLAEYGPRQYELVCRPTEGVTAADQAVIIREVAREVARDLGLGASFAPKLRPEGVGNGVHVHFSLRDRQGRP